MKITSISSAHLRTRRCHVFRPDDQYVASSVGALSFSGDEARRADPTQSSSDAAKLIDWNLTQESEHASVETPFCGILCSS